MLQLKELGDGLGATVTWEARTKEGQHSQVAEAMRVFLPFHFWATKNQFLERIFMFITLQSMKYNRLQST